MKKSILIAVVLAVMVGLLGSAAMAANGLDVWQIGKPNGAVDPIDGAAEYPATEAWYETFDYYVGTDSDPINSPTMPGYIGPDNVCAFAGGRPCTDTTANLNIHFGLAYDIKKFTLIYDRYGSESDNLYLDGIWFATISATEGGFRQFSFPLEAASSGNHTITIEYAGGGSGNGHYIDYLKLQPAFTCVAIDIKPGSDPNCFNSDGHGVIPVAILGSADFDASTVDPFTVTLDGTGVRVKGKSGNAGSLEDVNGDGFQDLVVQIVDEGGYSSGDTAATLSGYTYDDVLIVGSDSICIRPPE